MGGGLGSTIWAIGLACLLPFVWTVVAKIKAGFRPKDNQNPRAFLANATGVAARANAAQANSFETLPMFLAATLLALYCFVPQPLINNLVWLYVALRVGYGVSYLLNLATLRSILWGLSMVCIVLLFVMSARVMT